MWKHRAGCLVLGMHHSFNTVPQWPGTVQALGRRLGADPALEEPHVEGQTEAQTDKLEDRVTRETGWGRWEDNPQTQDLKSGDLKVKPCFTGQLGDLDLLYPCL